MGNDNRVAGKGRGGGHIQRLHWGIFASSHSRGCAAVWTSRADAAAQGKPWSVSPACPLLLSFCPASGLNPQQPLKSSLSLGFPSLHPQGHMSWVGMGWGKWGGNGRRHPRTPQCRGLMGFSVLPPWSGHLDKELRAAGPHFVLRGAFISRELTRGFKMLPN